MAQPQVPRSNTVAYTNRDEIDETGFVFDSNGNPTTYNGTSATWNDENKMTAFGSALTAAYRPDGMRAYKSNGTTTTYFIYDQNGVPVQEIVGGSVSAVNTFGPNGLISRNASSDVFYRFDERGDTVDRTNLSGTVLDYHGSDPYGQQYSSAAVTDPYQGFGAQWGYYYDSETGYSLLGERYYDPAAGRFLNQDPIGFGGGINVYSYGGNNPVTYGDPSGLDIVIIVGAQGSNSPGDDPDIRGYTHHIMDGIISNANGEPTHIVTSDDEAYARIHSGDYVYYIGHSAPGILTTQDGGAIDPAKFAGLHLRGAKLIGCDTLSDPKQAREWANATRGNLYGSYGGLAINLYSHGLVGLAKYRPDGAPAPWGHRFKRGKKFNIRGARVP